MDAADITSPRRILIIDDEPETVSELAEILVEEGFECQKSTDAMEALDLVEHMAEIGVVITDIRMPRLDGLELIRQLRDRIPPDRDLHTIVITGHADMDEAIRALKLGASDFLTKPLALDHLILAIKRAQEQINLKASNRQLSQNLAHEVRVKTAETRALSEALIARNQKLVELNAELETLSQMKTEFLNMLSHELNTPLNAILGHAEMCLDDLEGKGDENNVGRLKMILESASRVHGNVNRILVMAQLRGGRYTLQPTETTTDQVVDHLQKTFAARAQATNIQLSFRSPATGVDLTVDMARLLQMVGEALDNALKWSPPESQIGVEISNRNDWMVIRVRDSGPGMSQENIAASMDLVRRVDGAPSRVKDGMGLGLPLASALASVCGGTMDIDSIPDHGTTVTFSLPRFTVVSQPD